MYIERKDATTASIRRKTRIHPYPSVELDLSRAAAAAAAAAL